MAASYNQFSLGVKQDINDKFSVAVIMDQPFGANVDYPASAAPYPLAGSVAEVKSQAITALARYKVSDRFSVHGGLRYLEFFEFRLVREALIEREGADDPTTVGLVVAALEDPSR